MYGHLNETDDSLVVVEFTYDFEYDLEREDDVITGILPSDRQIVLKGDDDKARGY